MMICLPRNSNLKICLNGSGKAISTSLSEIGLLHRPQQKQFGCQCFPKQLRNCPYPRGWLQPAQFELTHCKTNTKSHVSFYLPRLVQTTTSNRSSVGASFFRSTSEIAHIQEHLSWARRGFRISGPYCSTC